jgi:hypothetical protein
MIRQSSVDGVPALSTHAHAAGRACLAWRRLYSPAYRLRPQVRSAVTRFLPGWRRAASIFIPTSSLQPSWPEKPAKAGRIGFWPAPQGDRAFLFDLLIREVDAEGLTLNDVVGEVGRIDLPSGGGVWVIANEGPMNSEALTWITRLRRSARTRYVDERGPEAIRQLERPTGAGWGYAHDVGRPVIIDLGDLSTSAPD